LADIAISVAGLGKWYVVNENRYRGTLSEVLGRALSAPFRRVRGEEHVHRAPDAIWALRDLSFELEAGKVMGVIGRNGSGKSTLLRILARITTPTEGTAMLRGRVGALLEVGTGFHPDLSGRENILLAGTMIGMTPAEVRAKEDEIIAFSEVEDFIDTPVKHYSSGMFMRLAFAVAAHLEAEIMLVDEVLAVGDEAFQKKCKEKIRETSLAGRTVLFTSHDMKSVEKICQSCLLLDHGRVVRQGDVRECIREYKRMCGVPDTELDVDEETESQV
jgi:lipopolysaccharide transport system ATP-binding protein